MLITAIYASAMVGLWLSVAGCGCVLTTSTSNLLWYVLPHDEAPDSSGDPFHHSTAKNDAKNDAIPDAWPFDAKVDAGGSEDTNLKENCRWPS